MTDLPQPTDAEVKAIITALTARVQLTPRDTMQAAAKALRALLHDRQQRREQQTKVLNGGEPPA